jgi:ABC-type nitrate/sulfonate/bicarbonate transport system ATPase subunit
MDRQYTRNEPLLSVSNVSLSLGEGTDRRLILRDVNAEIRNVVRPGMKQGQVTGFLGPSGIGKSQLFKIIAGFNGPDEGMVKVGLEQVPTKAGLIGVVDQHYRVLRHRNVIDNLVLAGKQSGLSKSDAKEKALAYLEQFDLSKQLRNYPDRLSGGQRQRLAILQQLMLQHQIICMDEPFSGLDVNQVHKVAKLISDLTSQDEFLTIIVVTHDIGAAIEVSDTLWLMGQELNPEKPDEFLPGARIVDQCDLIAEELAWDPGIRQNPKFFKLESNVAERFRSLTRVT